MELERLVSEKDFLPGCLFIIKEEARTAGVTGVLLLVTTDDPRACPLCMDEDYIFAKVLHKSRSRAVYFHIGMHTIIEHIKNGRWVAYKVMDIDGFTKLKTKMCEELDNPIGVLQ